MSPALILSVLVSYFLLLFAISYFTGRKSSDKDFFVGGKNSKWYVVAFGMIGASLSGVTFISIPGAVGAQGFSYMQMVLGYLLGYVVIAQVLLPLYYRLNLTSIYAYLEQRFGFWSHKTGAAFFLISRVIGASFRLYLVAFVLDAFVFSAWDIPFWVTVAITIGLIWIYSFKGGIKTIVWTDTLQTTFMLLAVVLSIWFIASEMDWTFGDLMSNVKESNLSNMWVSDWSKGNHFIKHFFSGMFITIVMTGLDQDMMQKNLSCKNVKEARKNVYWMSAALVPVNLVFLTLGCILFLYGTEMGFLTTHYDAFAAGEVPQPLSILNEATNAQEFIKADHLFPTMAINFLGPVVGLVFIIGLIAAAYSSADSALTALTTSFCVDFLGYEKKSFPVSTRYLVHVGFSLLLLVVIVVFKELHNDSLIVQLFKIAGYTYGPLLGLYAFGLFTKSKVFDKRVPFLAVACVILSYALNWAFSALLDFEFGFMILLVNGGLMMFGLWTLSITKSPWSSTGTK